VSRVTQPPKEAWVDWGGDGPPLHFAHANGFPPASYGCLLAPLTEVFRVGSFAARPLWSLEPPCILTDWTPLADDLGRALENRRLSGVVGVGHSLGGVLMAMVAAARPGLFSALVLIDPVVFTYPRSWAWAAMQKFGRAGRFRLVRGARERRDHWPDLRTVAAAYRGKSAFAGWTEAAFDDYLEAGFEPEDSGVRLTYPKEWEAQVFEVCPADVWSDLRRIEVPVLFLRGETSDTFLRSAAARAEREMADARVREFGGSSHFLPFEEPGGVTAAINEFVREVLQ